MTETPAFRPLWGMVLRDLTVLRRNFVPLMVRTVMNPLLFVFVFTYVFPTIGTGVAVGGGAEGLGYATVVVPGLVAVGMGVADKLPAAADHLVVGGRPAAQ